MESIRLIDLDEGLAANYENGDFSNDNGGDCIVMS
jgi:hypothetical protein